MMDLIAIHKDLVDKVNSSEITLEEASDLYDKLFNEQANDLILDVFDAFENSDITGDEANAYIYVITEATKCGKKDKGAIDSAIHILPLKEKKAIEDSIKKAAKVSNTTSKSVNVLHAIDDIVNKKFKKSGKKAVKESVDETFDLDAELELFESTDANKKYLDTFKSTVADYKRSVAKIKTDIKSKNFKEARKEIAVAKKHLDSIERDVDKIDSDTTDDVMAAIGNTLKSGLVATLIFGVLDYDGIGVSINKNTIGAGAVVGIIDTAIKAIRSDDNGRGLNVYKEKVHTAIRKERSILDAFESKIDKLESK